MSQENGAPRSAHQRGGGPSTRPSATRFRYQRRRCFTVSYAYARRTPAAEKPLVLPDALSGSRTSRRSAPASTPGPNRNVRPETERPDEAALPASAGAGGDHHQVLRLDRDGAAVLTAVELAGQL
jgi:hypothetical protein